jgi:hypothetical protein
MKAFPITNEVDYNNGMDLRDYFAAKAMPLAMKWVEHNYSQVLHGNDWMWNEKEDEEEDEDDATEIAGIAYHIADAMMKARSND